MSDSTPPTELVTCESCGAAYFVADLDFPEPDDETNTQFGWLVASCPACKADIKVGLDKINALF